MNKMENKVGGRLRGKRESTLVVKHQQLIGRGVRELVGGGGGSRCLFEWWIRGVASLVRR